MNIELRILSPESVIDEWVKSPYDPDEGFTDRWWAGNLRGPAGWFSFTDTNGAEVARAKVKPNSYLGAAYPTWTVPPTGASEVDLLEVRRDARGGGIGGCVVRLIRDTAPGPFVAMSLDSDSDKFWRSLGWTEHLHEDDDGHRHLFSLMA